jgi:hypothetical protein
VIPGIHEQSPEAEDAQSQFEAAAVRFRMPWAEDPIVKRICEVLGRKPEEVTPEMRRKGKVLFWAEMYGGQRVEKTHLERVLRLDFAKAEEMVAAHVVSVPNIQQIPRCHGKSRVVAYMSQAMAAGHWLHSELEKYAKQGHVVLDDSVIVRDEADTLRYCIEDLRASHAYQDRFTDYAASLRDDVENGVKVRQWQPAKGERPTRIGVDPKQKAKNRAARKAAKVAKKKGRG